MFLHPSVIALIYTSFAQGEHNLALSSVVLVDSLMTIELISAGTAVVMVATVASVATVCEAGVVSNTTVVLACGF